MQPKPDQEIKLVRPEAGTMTRQKLPYFIGISGDSAGSKGISMNLVVIPPGGSARPVARALKPRIPLFCFHFCSIY